MCGDLCIARFSVEQCSVGTFVVCDYVDLSASNPMPSLPATYTPALPLLAPWAGLVVDIRSLGRGFHGAKCVLQALGYLSRSKDVLCHTD